jgi:dienelactone hydrolase
MPRPPLPLSAPAATAKAVPTPKLEAFLDLGGGRSGGVLTCGDEVVHFQHLTAVDGPPRPLVLLVPILAGGEELLDQVAMRLLDRGFDVAFCARVASAMKPPQRARELDALFARTVLHQRALLAWLREAAPAPGVFVLGMSMGGMVTTVVAALEPDIDGVAICLAGGDLASVIHDSSEGRVQSWVRWRKETDGVGEDHLDWEFRALLRHEPLAFGSSIAAEKVLFVSAGFDSVVPRAQQDLLWESLGRPARLVLPLGHYTAALAIDQILDAAATHFAGRMPASSGPLLAGRHGRP